MKTEDRYPNHLGLAESLVSPMTDEEYKDEINMLNSNFDLEELGSVMRKEDVKYLNMTFDDK